MIQHQCTVLETLNYDIDQCDALAVLYRNLTEYADQESQKAMLRLTDAEKRYGLQSEVVRTMIREAAGHHYVFLRLNDRFQQTLIEYEEALAARRAYFE